MRRTIAYPTRGSAFALLAVMSGFADAGVETLQETLARCRAIDDSAARLACYDELAVPPDSNGATGAASSIEPPSAARAEPAAASRDTAETRARDAAGSSVHSPAAGSSPVPAVASSSAIDDGPPPDTAGASQGRASSADKSDNVLAADVRCPASMADGLAESPLTAFWELYDKCGRFGLKTYRQNYLLFGRYSNSPDAVPTSPTHPSAPLQSARRTEAKFQLSLRFKLLEDLPLGGADVWAAYTQQSNWQVYDSANSRPFRETDYEPELMVVLPTRYDTHLLGLTGRYVSFGVVHQSNGQSDPLSRSWNRVYAQFGFDAGNFSLQVRPWLRLHEPLSSDDNPDVEHYLGHGDIVASYRTGKFEASLLVRDNLHEHSNRGAAKLDVSFPTWPQHNLRFYLQAFSGYGETLVDYNHRQTTVGFGIMLDQ